MTPIYRGGHAIDAGQLGKARSQCITDTTGASESFLIP